ncbi:MAG TPA: efflux RND transporter periplasmic adaptor subunit [Burkholderiales bacterium]|nr:efflux RND transporter periplasmic adaptor subunit [Burkholderiales bacterium]
MLHSREVLSAVSLIAVLSALSGCGQSRSAPPSMPPPPAVSVATVIERQVNDWDEFTGRLEAIDKVEVRPRVSGYIDRIAFREGSEVNRGDLLFEIDARPFQADLDKAEADLARARSQSELAQSQLRRAEQLLKQNFISQEAYDDRTSASRESSANVRAAEAAVESARLNLEYTKVRAPVAGRVSRAEVTVGNLVTGLGGANATLLTTVVSLDPIYAYFEGDEQVYLKYTELARAQARPSSRTTRNPIYLELANEQGYPHKGYVDFVDNQLNPQTGTIRARAVFDNKERIFTPGLFARLKLIGSSTYDAILVDARAIGTDQSKKFVLVVGADNKATYREVKLGPIADNLRVVKQGLNPGERIVVNGIQRVRPGQPVTPQIVSMEGDGKATVTAANSATTQ